MLPTAAVAAAIFGTQVSTRERNHRAIGGLQTGASTTRSTDIVTTVTSTAIGIAPLPMGIVGIEAAVRTGGGRKAVVTGQIMTEGGYLLITEVTSVTGSGRGRGIGTVTAEDHHHQTDPTKRITREQAADLQAEKEKDLDGRRTEKGGLRTRAPLKRKITLLPKTKRRRRMHRKRMRRKMRNY